MTHEPHARSDRRYRELDSRESNGLTIGLYWDSLEDAVFVRVRDRRTGDDFTLHPPKQEALSAFHHPCAIRLIESASFAAAQTVPGPVV
jgi:hypothetical protein